MRQWITEKAAWKERGGLEERYKWVRLFMYICNSKSSMENTSNVKSIFQSRNLALSSDRMMFSKSRSFSLCKQTTVEIHLFWCRLFQEHALLQLPFCQSVYTHTQHSWQSSQIGETISLYAIDLCQTSSTYGSPLPCGAGCSC